MKGFALRFALKQRHKELGNGLLTENYFKRVIVKISYNLRNKTSSSSTVINVAWVRICKQLDFSKYSGLKDIIKNSELGKHHEVNFYKKRFKCTI